MSPSQAIKQRAKRRPFDALFWFVVYTWTCTLTYHRYYTNHQHQNHHKHQHNTYHPPPHLTSFKKLTTAKDQRDYTAGNQPLIHPESQAKRQETVISNTPLCPSSGFEQDKYFLLRFSYKKLGQKKKENTEELCVDSFSSWSLITWG